jgi:hypothetical protein
MDRSITDLIYYNPSLIKTQTAVRGTAGVILLRAGGELFRYHLATAVVTAVRANPVGKPHFAAIAALNQLFWF